MAECDPSPKIVSSHVTNTFSIRILFPTNNLIDRSTATLSQYFYPPSIDNQQTGPIMNGLGRTDITVTSCMVHLVSDQISNAGYNFLYGNTVNEGGGRCIWTQDPSARYIVLQNTGSNCNMDRWISIRPPLIVMRSTIRRSTICGTESSSSSRIPMTRCMGTTTMRDIPDPPGHGVGVYNNATSSATCGVTKGNTVFSSTSDTIVAINSCGDGILFDTQFPGSIDNYISQTTLASNETVVNSRPSNGAEAPEFFNPRSIVDLALNQPVTASSTAAGSRAANAVDGVAKQ